MTSGFYSCVFAVAAALGSVTISEGRDLFLVGEGDAAEVVVAGNALPSSRLAAAEFTNYVAKVSGRALDVTTWAAGETGRNRSRVHIGTLEAFPGEIPAVAREALARESSYEAYWIGVLSSQPSTAHLYIVGKDETAELYAVYHFLEERLGVRWFKQWTPEDDGEFVPETKEIVIPEFSKCRAPCFRYRRLSQTGSSCAYVPEHGYVWSVRLGLQITPIRDNEAMFVNDFADAPKNTQRKHWDVVRPRVQRRLLSLGGGHMTYFGMQREQALMAEHPEYNPLVGGVRTNYPGRACHANPGVQRWHADDIIRRFDRSGGRGSYLFGEMDGSGGYCECDACRALDTAEEKAKGLNMDISTRCHSVYARVAKMVYEKYPEANLINWAYSVYKTPTRVKLDPRTGAELCIHGRCYGHPLGDPNCERNPGKLRWLKDWLKSASWVKLYEYAHCSHTGYCPLETIIGDDLRLYRRLGVKGWSEEMHYQDSVHVPVKPKDVFDSRREYTLSHWQWLYLAGRLTWDPDQDDRAILADAEEKYYGAAYPAMKKYQAGRRRLWRQGPTCLGYGAYPMGDERSRTLLDMPGSKDMFLKLLDQAEALVKNDPKRLYRVRQDRAWLTRYWIEPNEKRKKGGDPTLRAVETAAAPVVDGSIADSCWGAAKWAAQGLPPSVNVAAVTDCRKLYFLFKVDGSGDMVKSDRLGLVLYPPDADATGRSQTFSVDLKNCARASASGYTAELEVDPSKLGSLRRGQFWRVRYFRNPDGNEPDICYPVEIGEPKLANGSFECLKENGRPDAWDHVNGESAKIVEIPGGMKALLLRGDYAFQGLSGLRSLGTAKTPRRVKVSFRAWGKGSVSAWFCRYLDTPDPKNPHKYVRTMPKPGVDIGRAVLDEKPRFFSFEAEIPAGEWVSLFFRGSSNWDKRAKKTICDDVYLDDVSITE